MSGFPVLAGKTSFDAQELASLAFEIEEGTIQVDTFPNTADVTDVVEGKYAPLS